MRVAVTGASGFIGTELIKVLAGMSDVDVVAFARKEPDPGKVSLCDWKIVDYSEGSLVEALDGVDAVIHLAGVRGTTSDPSDYAVNHELTESLLKAMARAGVGRVVFASTISVYDDEDLIPWTEDSPLCGRTAYGDSKITCERLILEYSDRHGFSYGIARIAQVLGEGETRRGMMNTFMDTAREHGTLTVIGKSEARRQYIYIRDLVEVLAELACASEDPLIVNVGMPKAYTNLDIATIVNRVYGNPSPIDYRDSVEETIRSSYMDTGRLEKITTVKIHDMEAALTDLSARTVE